MSVASAIVGRPLVIVLGVVVAAAGVSGCASSAVAPSPATGTATQAAASGAPVSTPRPLPTPRPFPDDLPAPAGPYVLRGDMTYGVPPLDITFTIPADGWTSWGPGVVNAGPGEYDGVGLSFQGVANLWNDPCGWERFGEMDPAVGPSVADLVTAFRHQPRFSASEPANDTVDGFDAVVMTMTIDDDLDFATCDRREVHSWIDPQDRSRYYQGPGQVEKYWIVDVDGTRLVIEGSYFPDGPSADIATIESIVDSVKIEP